MAPKDVAGAEPRDKYKHIFETAGVSIWEEDFSDVKRAIEQLRVEGVRDFAGYFRAHPEWVDRAIGMVRICRVNPATLRLCEATSEEELLASLHTVFVPETRDVFVGELLAIAEERMVFETEAQLQTLTGRRIDVYFTITFPPPTGSFDTVLVTLTDITDRKRVEMAVRESESRFRSFADTAPAMLWVTEADGSCSFLSRAWYDFTGQSQESALGTGWLDAVHPDDREASRAIFVRANATSEPFELEYRLRRADGVYRWAIDVGRPRRAADGTFLGFVGSCIDITERKESEDALRRSNQMKDEFLATLSHELRTPLNAVLGWAHMLRGGALSPELAARALESLERNARAQTQLIDELLDMSRIVSGRLQLAHEPVDMAAVAAAAMDAVRPAAATKGVELQVITHASETIRVKGDADRLRQILWNLLSNAIKFTPSGGRVHLELRCTADAAEMIVRDSGEGIDEAFLPFVFERFRQADSSSTRRHGGLGLGLSIARHLAEAHGGSITAESDGRNRGATFTLRLPREATPKLGSAALRDADGEAKRPLLGVSILVVDDEADARELLRVALDLAGATVAVAASTRQALSMCLTRQFDLLLVDVGMPEEDGFTLMRHVRSLPSPFGQVPAIAVTAYAGLPERASAHNAGFNAHVGKPIEVERLLAVILDTLPHSKRPLPRQLAP